MQIFEKLKIFCCIYIVFLKSTLNFEQFEKRSLLFYIFLKVLTRKDVLKCIKVLVFENASAVNMLASPKNY